MIQIEKGIPFQKNSSKYPFLEMEVGDSFLVKDKDSLHSARMTAQRFQKYTGKKFSTRKVEGGYRFWRVK